MGIFNMKNKFCCPFCKTQIEADKTCCGYQFRLLPDGIVYDHELMLLNKFSKDFILNKALNSNGHLSYYLLPEGSISLSDRQDVQTFASYVNAFHKSGVILDIGCGPLEVPGYLLPLQDKGNDFYGVDPLPDIKFKGTKVIGCCEYLPFEDESVDTLIFSTTIDHVCNLNQTFKEASRVLKKGGKVICWHWYDNQPFEHFKKRVKFFFDRKKRYYPICNGITFVIPEGAQDPFHKRYIDPMHLVKLGKKHGLDNEDISTSNSKEFKILESHYHFTLRKI